MNPPKGSKYTYNLNGKTKVFESTDKEDKQQKFVNNMIKKAKLKDEERPQHTVGNVNLFRHSFVSEKIALAKNAEDRIAFARLMRHSVLMSNEYVNDISAQNKHERLAEISDAEKKQIDDRYAEDIFQIPDTRRFSERQRVLALPPPESNKQAKNTPKSSKRKGKR